MSIKDKAPPGEVFDSELARLLLHAMGYVPGVQACHHCGVSCRSCRSLGGNGISSECRLNPAAHIVLGDTDGVCDYHAINMPTEG